MDGYKKRIVFAGYVLAKGNAESIKWSHNELASEALLIFRDE